MQALFSSILDALVPPRRTERLVRELSLERLAELGGGEALPYHDPRVQALVWELKYRGSRRARALAGAYLADTLLELASEELGVPLLVPVPMHRARRRERGHNQTEVLCEAIIRSVGPGFSYAPEALRRMVDTPHQQGLPREKRLKNVHRSMQGEAALAAGRVCIVVDDVATTGATLDEARRALRQAGARAVHCVALARA